MNNVALMLLLLLQLLLLQLLLLLCCFRTAAPGTFSCRRRPKLRE